MSRPRALENIRVVDFSWVRAGPWATRWLGALGAEIIKIEWPENERGRLPSTTTPQNLEVNLNTSGNFNDTNVNKKSLSLNVRSAKGLEIVKRLIAISDIVIENFSSRVLQNWGLGYEELCKIKPDIVYVSMSGYGHTGRHHHYTTFGPVAQAVSGLTYTLRLARQTAGRLGLVVYGRHRRHVRGDVCPDRPLPSQHDRTRPAYRPVSDGGERSAQRSGAAGLHRQRARLATGRLSSRQPGALAWHAVGQQLPRANGGTPQCLSHPSWRIQRLVRDRLPLRRGMAATRTGDGRSVLGHSPKFTTVAGRLQHQEELDDQIEAWSMTLGKYELTERCQAAGVRALPVQSAEDRVEHDPQLRHREMYLEWSIRRSVDTRCRTPRSNCRRPRRRTTCRAR